MLSGPILHLPNLKVNGAMRVTLGRFPSVNLAQARVRAREAIAAAATGVNPRKIS